MVAEDMSAFLKDHGLTLLLVLAGIGTVSGWTRASHHQGMAEAHEQEKLRAVEAAKASAKRATASAQRAAEAERETERVRERLTARIATLTDELADLDNLNASLEDAAEAEIREHDGWVTAQTHRERVGALLRTVAVTDSLRQEERAGRLAAEAEVGALKVYVSGLLAHGEDDDETIAAQEREIIALRAADDAGSIFPDFGDLTKPVYVAAGALLGWGGAKLTQSEAR